MATPEVKKLENWVEEAKIEALYHPEGEVTLSTLMLERSKTNARHSVRQGRLYVAYANLLKILPDNYRERLSLLLDLSSDMMVTVDGYSRKQAIEAEGKRVSGDIQQEKKKGILGLLGF